MKYSGKKGMRGPSLSRLFSPLTLMPKGKGLAAAKVSGPKQNLPSSWSWKDHGGNKISPVTDQCQCGCCWAVAATTALADRFGIKHDIEAPRLSSAWTVMKIGTQGGPPAGCQCSVGGGLAQASCGFEEVGVKLDACYPFGTPGSGQFGYVCQMGEKEPSLPEIDQLGHCCTPTEKDLVFKIVPGSSKMVVACDKSGLINQKGTHDLLKAEIANNGPVATTFMEYKDFQSDSSSYYQSPTGPWKAKSWKEVGVYRPKKSYDPDETPGGHAVVITGWGTQKEGPDKGVEYWEVRNSWGVQGAGQGYFKYEILENDPCCFAVPTVVHLKGAAGPLNAGGAIAFTAGDLPSGFKSTPGTGKKRSPTHYKVGKGSGPDYDYKFFSFTNHDGSLNWPFLLTLLLVASLLVILVVFAIPRKKK